jgi:hypothetical protein
VVWWSRSRASRRSPAGRPCRDRPWCMVGASAHGGIAACVYGRRPVDRAGRARWDKAGFQLPSDSRIRPAVRVDVAQPATNRGAPPASVGPSPMTHVTPAGVDDACASRAHAWAPPLGPPVAVSRSDDQLSFSAYTWPSTTGRPLSFLEREVDGAQAFLDR